MSIDTMQLVLCRGLVDRAFLSTLLSAPDVALAPYDLSPAEAAVFSRAHAASLSDLARAVEAWRRGELSPAGAPALAFSR